MMMMWAHWVSLDWVGAAWHWPRNDKGLTSSERGLGPHTALCTVCVWVMAIIVIPGYCSELLILCHSILNIYLVCIVALFLFIPVLFVLSAFIFWQWQSIITRRNQEAGWGPPLHNIRGQMTLGHINQRWCIVFAVLVHNVGYNVGCNGQELWEACQVSWAQSALSYHLSLCLLVTVNVHSNTTTDFTTLWGV